MEHRYCAVRHPCDIKILICKHKKPIAFGRIKNGSSKGLFIETDFKDFQSGQLLTLDMMLHKIETNNFSQITINALVIHKTTTGFGTEIDIQTKEHEELLIKILSGDPTQLANINIFCRKRSVVTSHPLKKAAIASLKGRSRAS